MDIDNLTLGQLKEIQRLADCAPSKDHSLNVGDAVLIRTISFYYTGRIKSITACDLVLEDAAWIADTGRFSQALNSGVLGEVEPYPNGVTVSRAHVLDVSPWLHALPRDVK